MFDATLKEQSPVATEFLTKAISRGKMANSYVFVCKDPNFAESFALNLSLILNCLDKLTLTPCKECLNCKWLIKNELPQAFKVIQPEEDSKKEQVKIETIRELLSEISSTSDFKRIIFFKKAGITSLTADCCNLLLKSVEESNENITYIFCVNNKDDLLPTIASRSQMVYLSKEYKFAEGNNEIDGASLKDSLLKASELTKRIKEKQTSMKEVLEEYALDKYKNNKGTFANNYETINKSFSKSKVFMQSKNILEDLTLL